MIINKELEKRIEEIGQMLCELDKTLGREAFDRKVWIIQQHIQSYATYVLNKISDPDTLDFYFDVAFQMSKTLGYYVNWNGRIMESHYTDRLVYIRERLSQYEKIEFDKVERG